MGEIASVTLLQAYNGMSNADNPLGNLVPGLRLPLDILGSIGFVSVMLLFYLFPTGRYVPGRTRFVAFILTAASSAGDITPS